MTDARNMRKIIESIQKIDEEGWRHERERLKVDRVSARQDSTRDQLLDLITLAEENGMYDAADYIKLVLKTNFKPVKDVQ